MPLLAIISVVGLVAIDLLICLWSGYVLSVLWSWFVVPIFGLPTLSVPAAVGITVIAGLVTHQSKASSGDGTWMEAANTILYGAVSPLIALGAGWAAMGLL